MGPILLDANLGKGYPNVHKKRCYKRQIFVNEQESYTKIQNYFNYSNLECFFLGIQVGSKGMIDNFVLGQQVDLYTKTILVP